MKQKEEEPEKEGRTKAEIGEEEGRSVCSRLCLPFFLPPWIFVHFIRLDGDRRTAWLTIFLLYVNHRGRRRGYGN